MTTPAPSAVTPSASTTPGVDGEKKPAAADSAQGEGFAVPGGMGFAPLDFTPGQGIFNRKPLTFSSAVQMGYDDNINSASSKSSTPIKGSMLTNATQAMSLLIAQSRVGLSLDANLGGQYYWSRDQNQLIPTGALNLIFGYKLTPRAQLSGVVNGIYTNQPTQSVINGVTQSNGKGNFIGNSKFDLLYKWDPRFSTDTSYSINGSRQEGSAIQSSDYITQTVGEALRYSFSAPMKGVLEGRYADRVFSNNPAGSLSRDTQTYFVLTGVDIVLSRLFNCSFRVGDATQSYSAKGQASSSSPYAESTLNYRPTPFTTVNLDTRYGYDDGSNSQAGKSFRSGVALTQVFTSKLNGVLSVNYSHAGASTSSVGVFTADQNALDISAGATYNISQSLSLSSNVTHTRRTSSDVLQEMTKNLYSLGLTYRY
ncbi:MAG: outer membrane beta-barrel protein [Verrucomicrobiota bacterium]